MTTRMCVLGLIRDNTRAYPLTWVDFNLKNSKTGGTETK